jgi:membrane-associated phospholipid phosphatase
MSINAPYVSITTGRRAVRSSEWVSLAYFAALTALAWARPVGPRRRLVICAVALTMCGAVVLIARAGGAAVRDWAPGVSILVGYYVAGRFFVRPAERAEAWLMAVDRRLLGDPPSRFARWPRPVVASLDLLYVCCFLLPPAGLAALVVGGHAALADRYWTIVAAAAFGAYGPLSIMSTRPPWLLERPATLAAPAIHRFASQMVERFTTRANTCPSGHVSASLAVACALAGTMPWTAAVFFVLALGVAVACCVGRYHYLVDLVSGAALALGVWAIAARLGL